MEKGLRFYFLFLHTLLKQHFALRGSQLLAIVYHGHARKAREIGVSYACTHTFVLIRAHTTRAYITQTILYPGIDPGSRRFFLPKNLYT